MLLFLRLPDKSVPVKSAQNTAKSAPIKRRYMEFADSFIIYEAINFRFLTPIK